MHHSNHSSQAIVIHYASSPDLHALLDVVCRSSRALLVQVAHDNLRGRRRQDAEDLVQHVFVLVLEGKVPVSSDPRIALLEMLRAVAATARSRSFRGSRFHMRR
jgi:hypothetical protein